jgi:hypothetical protein
MRNDIQSVPFTREGDRVRLSLTLEPMESVLVVFNQTRRPTPPRLTRESLTSALVIPVTGGPVPPPESARAIIEPSPAKMLTRSPVTANPFEGSCTVPQEIDLDTARIILEMDGVEPEEASRVTINGKNAGGFIGRPLRLEVTRHLKPGVNTFQIQPFAPRSVRLVVANTNSDPQTKP